MTLLQNLLSSSIASLAILAASPAWAYDFGANPGPSMVFVTQSSCHFCDRLDEQVISPLEASGFFDEQQVDLVRLSIDPGHRVTNFSGEAQSAVQFASQFGAYGTPTLLFFDGQGQLTQAPLYGVPDAIDFYGYKIEQAISDLN